MARLVLGTNKQVGVPAFYKKSMEPIPTGKYQLFDRVYTDTGTVIGTVCGFFSGAHDGSTDYQEYAVVILDTTYRHNGQPWTKNTGLISELPVWDTVTAFDVNMFHETATFATDILVSKNSAAAQYCRNFSFLIEGTTYYGQLPNLIEMECLFKNGSVLDNLDSSITPSTMYYFYIQAGKLDPYSGGAIWTSTQGGANYAATGSNQTGACSLRGYKTNYSMVFPILELPNA